MGGILLWSNKNHTVKIINNTIIFNGKVGIHCVGEDGMPSIENNIIENNNGSGVKIGLANKAKIIVNQIKLNQDGIEVISAEPYIFNNIIDKNYSDGVVTKVFDSLRCDAKIKNNEISGNKVFVTYLYNIFLFIILLFIKLFSIIFML
jgi:F-box protein 11